MNIMQAAPYNQCNPYPASSDLVFDSVLASAPPAKMSMLRMAFDNL